jgi:hypothetical protein
VLCFLYVQNALLGAVLTFAALAAALLLLLLLLQGQAPAALNSAYLAKELPAMRSNKTSSACLIKHSGKAGAHSIASAVLPLALPCTLVGLLVAKPLLVLDRLSFCVWPAYCNTS